MVKFRPGDIVRPNEMGKKNHPHWAKAIENKKILMVVSATAFSDIYHPAEKYTYIDNYGWVYTNTIELVEEDGIVI